MTGERSMMLNETLEADRAYQRDKHDAYEQGYNDGYEQGVKDAREQPEQRTGKCMWCERLKERNLRIEYYWIDEEGCTASFSEPHIVATGIAKFCPNCGADMRGEQG